MANKLILEGVKAMTLTVATLFPIINPLGVAPIFLNLTRAYPESVRKVLSGRIALYGFLLLGGSLVIGSSVLSFFGISLPIVQIAGGLVIAHTGWTMLNQESSSAAEGHTTGTAQDALQHAFYPLTLPLTVGPGCISVTVAFGAHIRQQSTVDRTDLIAPLAGAIAGMIVVSVLLKLCYQHASKLAGFLGPTGTNILVRLSAFLLLALGVQIMWNGFSSSLTSLLTKAAAD
ncbi:MAG: MarC family protein [Candidatus Solibacter sp.]